MVETTGGPASGAARHVPATARRFDPVAVRDEFPALAPGLHEPRLVYLDSAASAEKPQAVIDALTGFYAGSYSNVHRGIHPVAAATDAAYEGARRRLATFLGAPSADEVVFVRGATEGINLVARSFLRPRLEAGDEVLVTELEHHANIVPWQIVAAEAGARVVAAPITDAGDVDLDRLAERISPRTRLLAVTQVSNAIGTLVPLADVVALARRHRVPVLVDGAQAVAHAPVDVAALGCDFYVLSGHKLFGPTGIGVLWGRGEHLAAMPPYQGGGAMIRSVSFAGTRFADPPARFEAGTPHIAGAIGLAAAVDWLEGLDRPAAAAHEADLLAEAAQRLAALPGTRLVGAPRRRVGVLSFVVDGVHPHDVGTVLAAEGVAVRAGHHCAQPLMERLGLTATTRASFAPYNLRQDVDALVGGVSRAVEMLR
ncbi:MAG TPA: cysteine desulfurase [Thermoanaerobaculia bacterium]|nr:cysteine desulfurase [Thermoanaerobaculia bacterium]